MMLCDDESLIMTIDIPDAVLMTNLTAEFYNHLDDRNYQEALKAFAEDGVWFRRGAAVKGHQAMLAAMHARPANFHTRHVVSNVRVYQESAESGIVMYYLTGYSRGTEGASNGPPISPEDSDQWHGPG